MQNVLVDDRRIWVDLLVSFPFPPSRLLELTLSLLWAFPAPNPSRKWEVPGVQPLPPSVVVDVEEVEVVEEEEEEDAVVDSEVETILSRLLDSETRDTEDLGRVHPWGWCLITEVVAEEEDRRPFEVGRRGRGSRREVVEEEEDEMSGVEVEGTVGGGEVGVGVGVLRGEIPGIIGIEMIGGIGNEEEEGRGRVKEIEIGIGDDLPCSLSSATFLGADRKEYSFRRENIHGIWKHREKKNTAASNTSLSRSRFDSTFLHSSLPPTTSIPFKTLNMSFSSHL